MPSSGRPLPWRRTITITVATAALATGAQVVVDLASIAVGLIVVSLMLCSALVGMYAAGTPAAGQQDSRTLSIGRVARAYLAQLGPDTDTVPISLIRPAATTYVPVDGTAAQLQAINNGLGALNHNVTQLAKQTESYGDAQFVNGVMSTLDKVNGWPANVHRLPRNTANGETYRP